MFGTLVVSLPSAHEGGELLVRHAGREVSVDLRGTDLGEAGFAAFYADCEHEVRPVVSGNRVCVIYNLILDSRKRDGAPRPPDDRAHVRKAAEALRQWTARSDDAPKKVAYLLEHKYTPSGLSFSGLKGRDAAIAGVMLEASKVSECAFHLGIVHIEESGWAEYSGYGDSRWGDDEDEYEPGEVCDSHAYIDEWCDALDRRVDFGRVPLEDKEVLPPDALECEDPDDIQFSEATGNAGVDFERSYLRAAIVLWPEASYDEICLSVGMDAGLVRLEDLVRSGAKESVERIAVRLGEKWSTHDSGRLDRLLRALAAHGDPELMEGLLPELVEESYDGSQNEALVEAARILPPTEVQRILGDHIAMFGPFLAAACMDLWNRLAVATGSEAFAAPLLGVLLAAIKKNGPVSASTPGGYAKPQANRIGAQTLSNFLLLVAEPRFSSFEARVANLPGENPLILDVSSTIVPALEACFSRPEKLPAPLANPLWRYAVVFYLKRSETPPPAPVDWAQDVAEANFNMPELRELVRFARDPVRQVSSFRSKKEIREQIHNFIERLGLDMTHVTERKGSPYTLVCTKTRATYERVCDQYRRDVADMLRLIVLPPAAHDDLSEMAARVYAACAEPGAVG